MPNTTIAEFVKAVDPDEMANHELSHLDPQCLSTSIIHLCILIFNIIHRAVEKLQKST